MVETKQKTALITGITGQDGSYLAEFLLDKGYKVCGLMRRSSSDNTTRIEHILSKISIYYGDLSDANSIASVVKEVQPDELYHLGAQSFVKSSFDTPEYTGDITGLGTTRVLEAIRRYSPKTRFYNAASSEMFGKVVETPQNESTPFYPRSPYGVAKLYAYWMTKNYRESYGLFACSGIMFNHTSPRRGSEFVTKKVVETVAKIKNGEQKELFLGNLDSKRDWGFAGDYVRAMWLMLQQDVSDDYVVSSGETHSIRELCEVAFSRVGLNWQDYVRVDPKFFRPAEVELLIGDSTKAKTVLGWKPTVDFKGLVNMMVDEEMVK